jgi:two-component system sensor histidine kinase RpfC
MRALLAALLLTLAGFTTVLAVHPFWQAHAEWALGFLLMLAAVPLLAIPLMRELRTATARAIEASQAKSTFLANMSHELRTPLNGIIGASDLLGEARLGQEQQAFARIIHSSAHTLLELVDKALDISRIEAGRLTVHDEDFDLHRLINDTLAMMTAQARNKGLVLAGHVAPQTPFQLRGDARLLRQILINLIGNALKFTERGRVDVDVRPLGQAKLQRLRFEVRDTGIGIDKAAQARVFDCFFQADASITRRYGGTGLGTTIARQLVEAMGGRIGLVSRPGEGTTFWFELPFALQAGRSAALSANPFGRTLRVAILAGIEPAVRVQTLIRSWATRTVVVNSPARLLAELESGGDEPPVAAVLVERDALPGHPLAFLRQLQAAPGLAGLPVLLIESATDPSRLDPEEAVRAGFAAVLTTPVNSMLLFNALHAAVTRTEPLPGRVPATAAPRASGLRIRLAEDNPVNQRVICSLLEHAGHQTRLAGDGEQALALLQSGAPAFDLAIVDMHMPRLSGLELVRQWRAQESGRLPIVMLTADARDEAQCSCVDAGADAFLNKPVGAHTLAETVARLARRGADATVPAPLDEGLLGELLQLSGEPFVRDLIAHFTEDSRRALEEIRGARTGAASLGWREALHRLKGGARDIGAVRLAGLCAEAESVKAGEIDDAAIRAALDEALEALTAFVARQPRPMPA